jgi:hypothetical protein
LKRRQVGIEGSTEIIFAHIAGIVNARTIVNPNQRSLLGEESGEPRDGRALCDPSIERLARFLIKLSYC